MSGGKFFVWGRVLLTPPSCGNPCDGFGPKVHVLVLILRFLARPHEHGRFVQAVVGLYHGIRRMTAVHATLAFHPHEALGPLKVKKLVFHHQALAACAFHDVASLQFNL
jgi:hypothetical protein